MPIKVVCDICGEPHKVGENRVGAKMRCRACDSGIRVPKGPYIDEDEELLDAEENAEEDPPSQEGLSPYEIARRVRDVAGAIFGLVLMGFYVAFTIQFLTGEEAPPRIPWGSTHGSRLPSSSLPSPHPRANVPNVPRPAFPEFRAPNVPPPVFPDPNFPDPNFPNPVLPNPVLPEQPNAFRGRPNAFPGSFPGRPGGAVGAQPLQTDPEQPIVITSLAPRTGGPGTVVTLRGKGFEKTIRVVFTSAQTARLTDGSDAAEFKVVSDTELTAVAPRIVSMQVGGSIIEVHTPLGVAITWPENSAVAAAGDRGLTNASVVVRGSPSGSFTACNVLVESGATVDATAFSKVYVRAGGRVDRFSAFNAIVASTAAQPLPMDDGRNQPLYVPEIHPSYLPEMFNQKP